MSDHRPGPLRLKGDKKKKKAKKLKLKEDVPAETQLSQSQEQVRKTQAQIKFEQVQRQRMLERAKKSATKTHKDRVQEFNDKLEQLSEHYDVPKVGPG